jgi:hypothetical protein
LVGPFGRGSAFSLCGRHGRSKASPRRILRDLALNRQPPIAVEIELHNPIIDCF